MFVYLLIVAELGLLYGVFWYLYVREPRASKRINAQMWGRYDMPLEYQEAQAYEHGECEECRRHEQMLAAVRQEYMLDQHTNHYVQVPTPLSFLDRIATTVDR